MLLLLFLFHRNETNCNDSIWMIQLRNWSDIMHVVNWKVLFKRLQAVWVMIHFTVQILMQVMKEDINMFLKQYNLWYIFTNLVPIGTASESLNEWADEDAGIEAVQRILDALDDVSALQDSQIDPDVLISMLRDSKLHAILQVGTKTFYLVSYLITWFRNREHFPFIFPLECPFIIISCFCVRCVMNLPYLFNLDMLLTESLVFLPFLVLSLPLLFDSNMVYYFSFRMRKQIYGLVSILFYEKWPTGKLFLYRKLWKCQNFSVLSLISQKAHKFIQYHLPHPAKKMLSILP